MRGVRLGALLVGCIILGGCTLDHAFIFHPESRLPASPASAGLDYEEVFFKTADGVSLNGWWVPGRNDAGTMLWFHGNGGNIGHRVDNLRRVYDELGLSVFIFDYRGYGRSGGKVSEEGTYRDAEAALEYLLSRPDVDASRTIFFGRSLGSAVAIHLALGHPPRALILESPMTSIRDMARVVFPVLPIGFLIRTEYDSLSKIGKIRVPLLVLHGDRDEVIPMQQGRRLFEAGHAPKIFYVIPGASHNDTYLVGGAPYWDVWRKFLEGLPESGP